MWAQRIKTALILGALSGLLLLLGNLFAGTNGIIIAFLLSVAMNALAYYFSEKIVLSLYKAEKLDSTTYAWVYEIVAGLSAKMGIPTPKLWLIKTPVANAFATGRNPQHSSVAITSGILGVLDAEELRAVLAHELAHIKNRDILVSTIAATLATAIGYVADFMLRMAFWQTVNQNDNRRNQSSPLASALVALIMPVAALLLQLAVSRSREYLADETGATACNAPLALASALAKLEQHTAQAHFDSNDTVHASTAPLFIVHPFFGKGIGELFSTHPPMRKRIERLHRMYHHLYNR
jgi:heat shock protein HtpX